MNIPPKLCTVVSHGISQFLKMQRKNPPPPPPPIYMKCFSENTVAEILYNFVDLLFEPPHDKTNKMTVRPVKTQISLGIRPIWSESSLST